MTVHDAPPEPTTSHTPISGVVVTYEDARHLHECLSALNFCDELVVVDLGSEDESVAIAEAYGARIVCHSWVPAVEQVRGFAVRQARFEWIAFMDPDMVFPTQLASEVREAIARVGRAGIIGVPYRNYFLGKPVHYGRWGGNAVYPAVFHREAFDLRPDVHRGFAARDGANWAVLRVPPGDEIVHHWVESRFDMDARARRYAALEGEARYNRGERFTWPWLLSAVPSAFVSSLIRHRGYRDGLRGVALSFYSARLTGTFLLALRRFESNPQARSVSAGPES
jgi:glycosyltransferase involved in cell wall biosynthesis